MSDQVTVADLDELLVSLAAKKEECEIHAETLKEANKAYNTLLFKAAKYIEELGREKYESPSGKLEIKKKWRVNLPESDASKALLFAHLRERGLFDRFATVNSNSLNALYMADWRDAEEKGEGMTFSMPGVPAPKEDVKPEFKAAK